MLMQPAISINIVADEETIRMICATIALIGAYIAMVKGLAILKERKQ